MSYSSRNEQSKALVELMSTTTLSKPASSTIWSMSRSCCVRSSESVPSTKPSLGMSNISPETRLIVTRATSPYASNEERTSSV